MPRISLSTPTGRVDLHYNIATPSCHSSLKIEPDLPCILFLHAEYLSQVMFEAQFSDPQLRHCFNLIAIDQRSYGDTTGPVEEDQYTPETAADDAYRFMRALDLPPVHIFGVSIGCHVALEFAQAHPESVLSLTLCSLLPSSDPEDIMAGRIQVYDYWDQCLRHDGSPSLVPQSGADHQMLSELIQGSKQLMFSEQTNQLVNPLMSNAIVQNIRNWAGCPEKLRAAHVLSIDWFLRRKPFCVASLDQIRCPVSIIHCSDDLGYPSPEPIQDFASLLRRAGNTSMTIHQVAGPHLGNVINPAAINPILRDLALSASSPGRLSAEAKEPLCASEGSPKLLYTPFTARLALYGYDPEALGPDLESTHLLSDSGIRALTAVPLLKCRS